MVEWKPAIGERFYGCPVLVEEDKYLIRSPIRQTVDGQTVEVDEVFAVPKLVTMRLEPLINETIAVIVVGEARISGKKVWQCRIARYESQQLELN